jgi:creatinine amidohydrolase
MNLQEMTWMQAAKALEQTNLAIVPVGALEVYGPHLPMGSDGLVALEMAKRLSERTGAVITPLIPIGCSQSLMSFPTTLSVEPETLKAYLREVCNSLIAHGIKRILFFNGHAGNVALIGELGRELEAKGIKTAPVDWWGAVAKAAPEVYDTPQPHSHAGEACTSVLLTVRPDLVDKSQITKEQGRRGLMGKYPEVIQYGRPFREISTSGMTGDATSATREKGDTMIAKTLVRIEAFLQEWQ